MTATLLYALPERLTAADSRGNVQGSGDGERPKGERLINRAGYFGPVFHGVSARAQPLRRGAEPGPKHFWEVVCS